MLEHDQTPVEKIESLYESLLEQYGEGDERELRVAAKLLLVSLDRFRQYGGLQWPSLVREYLRIAEYEPDRFEDILRSNRGQKGDH